MIENHYGYPAGRFYGARRALMAPHPRGEDYSFGLAFGECHHGFGSIRDEHLDDDARRWVRTIRETMNTDGIEDPQGRGTWFLKAERLTLEEKSRFSSAVDELAHWFRERFMGRD
jgi:hypothetical protein